MMSQTNLDASWDAVLAVPEAPANVVIEDMSAGGRRKVIQVQKDSAADKAGLKVGDVILAIDGQPLADLETFNVIMSQQRWADRMSMKVARDGKEEALTVVFRRDAPEAAKAPQSSTRP